MMRARFKKRGPCRLKKGGLMRHFRLFLLFVLLLAVASLFSGACWADSSEGVDPLPTTKGCGKPGQPKCDAYFILPGQTGIPQITLTFLAPNGDDGSCVGALCNPYKKEVGLADIINGKGSPITSLEVTFLLPGFTFPNCGADGNGGLLTGATVFASCQLISGGTGSGTYLFTDGTLASVKSNGDDWTGGAVGVGTYVPDRDSDDVGMALALVPAVGEKIPVGTTVSASLSLPEPSSGLLFFFGLTIMGLVCYRRRVSLA